MILNSDISDNLNAIISWLYQHCFIKLEYTQVVFKIAITSGSSHFRTFLEMSFYMSSPHIPKICLYRGIVIITSWKQAYLL